MIGTILERKYQLIELIGSGGMANVYRAINFSNHRNVAVKVLKDEYCENAEFLRRFEREARTVLHLNQENIVHAYGVGEYNGKPYIILEYVEGKTLKELLNEHAVLPQKTAVNYTVQVLSALQAAHDAGIIHRDVKPQNVIITSSGKAKLTDFGIAREVQASTQTFAGSNVIGSAHYLSPEQAKGAPVSEESDIYSVGVMLYEMLTGTVPFKGETTVAVALKHLNEEAKAPVVLNPEIFPSINEVVMCALKKDPAQRFRSAAKMKRALVSALKDPAGHPVQAQTDSSEEAETLDLGKKKLFSGNYSHIPLGIKIGIIVLGLIAAFFGMFFATKAFVNSEYQSKPPVPSLIGKPVEEAGIRAQNYGFSIAVTEYEVNNEIPYGCVLTQSIEPGQHAKSGTVLNVTVSAGPDVPTVPNIIGMTYDEASAALRSAGYEIGHISYQVSDQAIGTVCLQAPVAGAELLEGNIIDFSISANMATTFEMPNITLKSVSDAVKELQNTGELSILLIYRDMEEGDIYGNVTMQKPAAGSNVQEGSLVTLYVSGVPEFDYSMDVVYNIDIPENNTDVIVAITDMVSDVAVERVLYNATLEAGEKIPLPLTVTASDYGIYELILYENNKEIWRKDISFANKG